MNIIKKYKLIIFIIFVAAFLRLYGISRGDPVNDETLMAFRAVGMIDFDEAAVQTTPFEWFDPLTKFSTTVPDAYKIGTGIPWWTHLSWHDHPAFVFAVQNFFMSVFGDHTWAFRLPSALLGIASVFLLYLIGKHLYDEKTGLYSALLYAVTLNGIYISRTGMQEPYVIFFILLSIYFLLKALKKDIYFITLGVILGLGTLAKYNTFFVVVPISFIYLALFHRHFFYRKKLWLGVLVFLITVSPIIIYNVALYRAVGHFDFQFSTIFGQSHPAWQVQPGKDIGTITDRLHVFVPRLIATNSWLFLVLFAISICAFLASLLYFPITILRRFGFLLISIFTIILLLFGIGPSYRFLTMLTPFMVICVGIFFAQLTRKVLPENSLSLPRPAGERIIPAGLGARPHLEFSFKSFLVFVFVAIIIIFEIFYSWNNQIAYYPIGHQPWAASKVRYENYNWGYNELTDFFEKEFSGKIPALTFDLRYQFLNQLRDNALQYGLKQGYQQYPALVVYYGNFDKAGKLWALDRLHIYHAWPIISMQDYTDYLQKNGKDFYTKAGFKYYYFIIPASSVSSSEFSKYVEGSDAIVIRNPRGDTAFTVYERF